MVTNKVIAFAESIGGSSLLGYIYSSADATISPLEDHTSTFICFYSPVLFLLLELVILALLFQPFRHTLYLRNKCFAID